MCYLLTFAVPKPIQNFEESRSLTVSSFKNKGGGHQHTAGWSVYKLTTGSCSCDLINLQITDASQGAYLAKARAKFEKKGWSQAKIERAMADKIGATDPPPPPLRPDAVALLSVYLKQQGHLDLIIHWHGGQFASEPFELRDTVHVQPAEEVHLNDPQEDFLYQFRHSN